MHAFPALLALCLALAARAQQQVQKLGVYDFMTEESSPVMFNGALLMLESIPAAYPGYSPAFAHCSAYLRVRDMRTLAVLVNITASCGQAFGAATVLPGASPGAPDTLLVTATQWDRRSGGLRGAWSGPCAGASPANCTVNLFFSSARDLADGSWQARAPGIPLPSLGVYNTDATAVPAAAGLPWRWVMALETTAEAARFLASASADPTDAAAWALLDASHTLPRLPDVGSCPSLRHDGAFFYYLTGGTDIHVLRSRDLVAWERAQRDVLSHSAPGDCVVAPAWFGGGYAPQGAAAQRLAACGAAGSFGDDSDVDLVAWPQPFSGGGPGGVLLEYGSGDQRTFGFSNLALYANSTMEAFLQSFF